MMSFNGNWSEKTASIDREKKCDVHMDADDVACMESGVKKTVCIDREKKCDVHRDTEQ